MQRTGRGTLSLRDSDAKPHAPPVEVYDDRVFFDSKLTVDKAMELGDRAIEEAPWKLLSKPYGVQAYTLIRCGFKDDFGFFLEQGLGKTKTTLADFWNRYEKRLNNCMVVVTVNSMKLTWLAEMEEENYPFDIHVWPKFDKVPRNPNGQVLIVNYEALRAKGGKFLMDWMRQGTPYLAFDESTSLMNHGSQQSKAGVLLAAVARSRRCLAGKPNPMGAHNLWPQLKVLGGPVGNFYSFRNTFCVMGGFQGRVITGTKNTDRLAAILAPRSFFADKRTWASTLPEKKFASLHIEMDEKQKRAYKTMAQELYIETEGGKTVTIERTLHKSMKLQQVAGGFVLDETGVPHHIGAKEPVKIRLMKDFIDNATGKTIIFAHFTESIRRLIEAFPGAPHALAKNRMNEKELGVMKARFNSDECMLPFIAPSSVVKFGHTLVGTPTNPCTSVVFFENTYSLLTRSQAEDRAHRWGATADSVTYYDLIASPIDKQMVRSLRQRENLAMNLLKALRGFIDA